MSVRMRSDWPNVTASEAERRTRAQAEFQAALRQQVEEKARLRAEEQQRWVPGGSCLGGAQLPRACQRSAMPAMLEIG